MVRELRPDLRSSVSGDPDASRHVALATLVPSMLSREGHDDGYYRHAVPAKVQAAANPDDLCSEAQKRLNPSGAPLTRYRPISTERQIASFRSRSFECIAQ